MDEEINEYIKYLLNFGMVQKPLMPKFNLMAYTDNEYLLAIENIMFEYDLIDDECVTIRYLKGD